MAINVQALITRVRSEITMDTDASDPRWPDVTMTDFVVQAGHELLRTCRHLLLDTSGAPSRSDAFFAGVTTESVANGTAVLPLPQRYTEALMHGVAMRCFLMDAADQTNAARATYERTRFAELLGGNTSGGAVSAG